MGTFSLPSAGGVVSLLNDRDRRDPSSESELSSKGRPLVSAFETASQHTSSTDSLARSNGRRSSSSVSSSPATSIEPSFDSTSRSSGTKSGLDGEKTVRLPGIEATGLIDKRPLASGGRPTFPGEHINNSPVPMSVRPGEAQPPSVTGVFPPGQWDRASPYHISPHLAAHDYGRRSSSASDMGPRPYQPPVSGTSYDLNSQSAGSSPPARKTVKEGGSSAITIGGKKRYPCQHPGCDKTFSTSGHAARHNRIHTGQKPYRCTFPGCKARFSRQDNSLQHYRTHILHPKGRASQSAQGRDGAGSYEVDGMVTEALDPEAEAKAELGRRALEDGTAIAVVHEVKDQHGRKKGETIERMVGMPRGRRDSLHSNLIEEERSTSPSSVDSARIERQNSMPGMAHADPSHYEGPSEFWASNVARHHRLSLPHPQGGMVPPEPYGARPGQRDAAFGPAWPSSGPSYVDPRLEPPSMRSTAMIGKKRDSIDPSSRTLPGLPDSDLRLDPALLRASNLSMPHPYARPPAVSGPSPRFEADSSSDLHRRSISMGTGYGSGAVSSQVRTAAGHPVSAPGSHMPSARSSQSPNSSPTTSSNAAPDSSTARPLSVLDKLGSGAGPASSLPSSLSSLTARSRLMSGATGSAGPGYQHPYSSDRSTNFDTSSSRGESPSSIPSGNLTLPLLHSGRAPLASAIKASDGELSTIDVERKAIQPLSSALRSGVAQEPVTLPPLNTSGSAAGRRW